MTVDPPTINAVFSGLVLLLGALATLVTARSKRVGVQRREFRKLQRRYLAGLGHIFSLETILAGAGIAPPPRPPLIDQNDEDEEAVPATPALPPQPRPEPP